MIDFERVHRIWKAVDGKAWEPPDPHSPFIDEMIEAGYIRRCNMRCGFELLKDAGVTWTEAGRMAMALASQPMDDIPVLREDAG